MSTRRSLYWKLNWYRHSELDGALLLGKVVRAAGDAELVLALTRHCAEEARHAWLWAETLHSLGLPAVRIFRSYQSFYVEHAGMPLGLTEVLALTHVFEQRVHRQFTEELRQPHGPAPVRRTLRTLLQDEERHLAWVSRWLAQQAAGPALVRRFQEIDERVYRYLAPYTERLWEIPGLGTELDAAEWSGAETANNAGSRFSAGVCQQ